MLPEPDITIQHMHHAHILQPCTILPIVISNMPHSPFIGACAFAMLANCLTELPPDKNQCPAEQNMASSQSENLIAKMCTLLAIHKPHKLVNTNPMLVLVGFMLMAQRGASMSAQCKLVIKQLHTVSHISQNQLPRNLVLTVSRTLSANIGNPSSSLDTSLFQWCL